MVNTRGRGFNEVCPPELHPLHNLPRGIPPPLAPVSTTHTAAKRRPRPRCEVVAPVSASGSDPRGGGNLFPFTRLPVVRVALRS